MSVKIAQIEVRPVRYPMRGYFKFFTGADNRSGREAVFIKITSDTGIVGWGQSVPIPKWSYETTESVVTTVRRYYAPVLLGHDVLDIPGGHAKMGRVIADGFTTGMPMARAGVDLAMHDLAGKACGKSVPELWGRQRGLDSLRLSWTVNPRSLQEAEDLVAEGSRRGYRDFNLKVAPDPEADAALARRVRELAPGAFVWADANGGYPDVATACRAARLLAGVGVDVLEAPLRPNRLAGYQALKRLGALPILMDEGIISSVELHEFIRLGMLDGVAMKPARCGGLAEARRQIELVCDAGLLWLGSGLTDPDLSLAAAVQLYATHGLERPAALNGPQFLAADALENPWPVESGALKTPIGPGLGVDINPQKLDSFSFARSGIES